MISNEMFRESSNYSDEEVEAMREDYLRDIINRAEIAVYDFKDACKELLEISEGTEIEDNEVFDEMVTALGAMGGAFAFHRQNPKKSGTYLVLTDYGAFIAAPWSARWQMWNVSDAFDDEEFINKVRFTDVVAYFDLPDPRKYIGNLRYD